MAVACAVRADRAPGWRSVWFAKITRDVIARGIFTSVKDLHRKLMRYIRKYNTYAHPLKWTYRDFRNRFATIDSAGTVH